MGRAYGWVGGMIEANNIRRGGREYFWFTLALLVILAGSAAHAATVTLLNVSYDPTRELYEDYNKAFAAYWKTKTGDDRDRQPKPRGIGQAGALRDRRTRGRRGDPGIGL